MVTKRARGRQRLPLPPCWGGVPSWQPSGLRRLMSAGALAVLAAGSASNSTITAIGGLGAAHRRQVRLLVGFYAADVVSFTKR
jgi:hypothetical protein